MLGLCCGFAWSRGAQAGARRAGRDGVLVLALRRRGVGRGVHRRVRDRPMTPEPETDALEVPAPTAWPMVLALGVTLAVAGLVTHVSVSAVGIVLALAAAVGWWRQVLPVEHVEHVPLRPLAERARPIVPSTSAVGRLRLGEGGHRTRLPGAGPAAVGRRRGRPRRRRGDGGGGAGLWPHRPGQPLVSGEPSLRGGHAGDGARRRGRAARVQRRSAGHRPRRPRPDLDARRAALRRDPADAAAPAHALGRAHRAAPVDRLALGAARRDQPGAERAGGLGLVHRLADRLRSRRRVRGRAARTRWRRCRPGRSPRAPACRRRGMGRDREPRR